MIKINDKYYVDTDGLNYALKYDQPGTNKNDEPIITTITLGYYRNLRQVIEKCISDTAVTEFQDNNYSLLEAIDKLKEIQNRFELLVSSIPEVNI